MIQQYANEHWIGGYIELIKVVTERKSILCISYTIIFVVIVCGSM